MFFSMYVIVEMEKEKIPFFSSNVYLGIRTPSDYKMTAPEKVAGRQFLLYAIIVLDLGDLGI